MNIFAILENIIYIPTAMSVGYIFIYALASKLPYKNKTKKNLKELYFTVIFPAYAEDSVIIDSINSIIRQNYALNKYNIIVVSDHMKEETNKRLQQLPIQTIIATYNNSSKAKALKLACTLINDEIDYIVILDADNIVNENFLDKLNDACSNEPTAIQCHRTAKNSETPTAILDAVSEEINNNIFRLGHNNIGISSALIGSGMCIKAKWFKENVQKLNTSGEDKEIEALLLAEGNKIIYEPDILVYDEKIKTSNGFEKQRRRWMAAQYSALFSMLKSWSWKIGYIDKVIQQTLIPRSICLCICIIGLLSLKVKWITLCLILIIALFCATPKKFYNRDLFKALYQIPILATRMLLNLFKLKGMNSTFLHTKHNI